MRYVANTTISSFGTNNVFSKLKKYFIKKLNFKFKNIIFYKSQIFHFYKLVFLFLVDADHR